MKDSWSVVVVLLGILGTFTRYASSDISLSLVTDPPGPSYPAASWVRFACRVDIDNSLPVIHYHWRGSCNSAHNSTEFIIDDPFLDEEGYAVIWVQATPTTCMDHLECSVVDDSGDEGVTGMVITNTTGVGLSIPSKSMETVANNSAIIIDQDTQPTELLCQSSSRWGSSSTVIRWRGPNGKEVSSTEQSERSSKYAYSSLSLDYSLSLDDGIYTCLVPDEYGQEWMLLAAVYSNSFPKSSLAISLGYRVEQSSVTLVCATTGLPATANLWSKDGILLILNETFYEDLYVSRQDLTDAYTASYSNTLEINLERGEVDGVYGCDVYSDWARADYTLTGREHVSGQFAHYTVGSVVTLNCAFPEDVHQVEWLYNGEVLHQNDSNMLELQLMVSDAFHDEYLTCRGTYSDGFSILYTKVIAYVPDNAVSLVIKDQVDQPTASQPFSITCCVLTHLDGISSTPQLLWIGPEGEEFSPTSGPNYDGTYFNVSETEGVLCGSINFVSLSKSHEGSYACVARLESPALTETLIKTKTFIMQVQGGQGAAASDEEPSTSTSTSTTTTAMIVGIASAAAGLLLGAITVTISLIVLRKNRKNSKNGPDSSGVVPTVHEPHSPDRTQPAKPPMEMELPKDDCRSTHADNVLEDGRST